MHDLKLIKFVVCLLLLPIGLAVFGGDRFRYPCQDPANWDKNVCQKPLCDVTRTCPEHIFKGQRDPREGAPTGSQQTSSPTPPSSSGASCGK